MKLVILLFFHRKNIKGLKFIIFSIPANLIFPSRKIIRDTEFLQFNLPGAWPIIFMLLKESENNNPLCEMERRVLFDEMIWKQIFLKSDFGVTTLKMKGSKFELWLGEELRT